MFIEGKDDEGGGDNWTAGAIIRAKLLSNHHHQQTNILQLFIYLLPMVVRARTACHFVHQLHHAIGAYRHQRSWEAKEDVVRMCEK